MNMKSNAERLGHSALLFIFPFLDTQQHIVGYTIFSNYRCLVALCMYLRDSILFRSGISIDRSD